jgi:hypothetical protein
MLDFVDSPFINVFDTKTNTWRLVHVFYIRNDRKRYLETKEEVRIYKIKEILKS